MGRTSTAELAAQCTAAAAMMCVSRKLDGFPEAMASEAIAIAVNIESQVLAMRAEQGLPKVEPLPEPHRPPDEIRSLVRGVFDAEARKWLRAVGVLNLVLWVSPDARKLIQVQANNPYVGREP